MARLFLLKVSGCEDLSIEEIKRKIGDGGLGYYTYPAILSELKCEDND